MKATLLNAVTSTATGTPEYITGKTACFQATVQGTGAVSATVDIQTTLDHVSWITIGTITLSGTTSASDGFAVNAPWNPYRAVCTAISGTSAALSVVMGA